MAQSKLVIFKFLILCLSLSFGSFIQANELRERLFGEVDEIYREAIDKKAGLLAPVSYSRAKDYYERADKNFQKNKSIDRIQKDVNLAEEFFKKAIVAANLAEITLPSVIKARNDAKGADAATRAGDLWRDAEKEFFDATKSMETGSLAGARRNGEKAENLYREAELVAIKQVYLGQVREAIAKAKKLKVSRHAPLTYEKSVSLLAKAEKELSENRYDTDYPRSLVRQSLYEAKHSVHIADRVLSLKKNKLSEEEFLLEHEKPIADIAESLDIVAEFDRGFGPVVTQIKERVDELVNDSYELGEMRQKMKALEKDYAALEKRLGIQSERMAQQAKMRKQIQKLDKLFNKNEAVVLTQGNNIILRMVGLTFEPSSAVVDTSDIGLLSKIQEVFRILDDYNVVIEGHTDSFGSDSANLVLSYDRATAVRNFFMSNMGGFKVSESEVKGYGENRPIANNETATGRRKNRRIDLVFQPN